MPQAGGAQSGLRHARGSRAGLRDLATCTGATSVTASAKRQRHERRRFGSRGREAPQRRCPQGRGGAEGCSKRLRACEQPQRGHVTAYGRHVTRACLACITLSFLSRFARRESVPFDERRLDDNIREAFQHYVRWSQPRFTLSSLTNETDYAARDPVTRRTALYHGLQIPVSGASHVAGRRVGGFAEYSGIFGVRGTAREKRRGGFAISDEFLMSMRSRGTE